MSDYVRAYEGSEPYVFVSYAHKDGTTVLPVIRELYDKKYRVWYDEGIAPGSEWPYNIEKHLLGASVIMLFISGNSLASPNCENEVKMAARQNKTILQVRLDDAPQHPLLSEIGAMKLDPGLIGRLVEGGLLGAELIGDCVAGYQYAIEKKRSFNLWNLMLGAAVVLAVAVSGSLFGLDSGWFDRYLPAKQPPAPVSTAPTGSQEQSLPVSGNLIGSVLPVRFASEDEKKAVYQILGWTQPNEMTYQDLLAMKGLTRLDISSDEPISDISFVAYLPNLEQLSLQDSLITDLTPLVDCPMLKTVLVSAEMLPLTIPKDRNFEIVVQ